MKPSTLAIQAVLGALLLGAAACHIHSDTGGGPEVVGDGVAKTEARPVASFHAIELDAAIRLELSPGPFDVSLSGDENLLPLISTTVSDGTLVVRNTGNIRSSGLPVLTVHAPGIDRVGAKGVGRIHASGIDVPHFALDAGGSCDIALSGKAERIDIDVAGLANVHASDVVAKEAHVNLSGTGNIEVNASDKLDANVSGLGTVFYRGSPTVAKTVAGLGTVKPMT
jgi:hypothetical protein